MKRRRPDQDADAASGPRFHRDMTVADAVDSHPGVQEILTEYGLPCSRCIVAWHETLAEGCSPLSLDVDAIVARLNALPPHA